MGDRFNAQTNTFWSDSGTMLWDSKFGDRGITIMPMSMAYCIKDKKKQYMLNPQPVILKNGANALKGECIKCHSTLYLMQGKLAQPVKTPVEV